MGVAVVLFCLFCVNFISCFNFDTDFPIVYTDPLGASRKPNDRASYFGYSVILHHDSQEKNAWIQIGAPRANSAALKNKEPGIIFRCEIFGPCRSIDVDTTPPEVSYGINTIKDKKDNAWIGGAMDIDERSGRTVVCGHRWINNRVTDFWMEGVCYWSHLNDTEYGKLLPLADYGKAIIADSNSKNNVFYYAQGQAGFSVHMTNLKNSSELLIGAPGVYNWDGTALIYRDAPDHSPVASRLTGGRNRQPVRRAGIVAEFSNLNIANTIATVQTSAFGLFGYSLTSGYFFNKNELYYVSGGPRSKTCIGQILVYAFAERSDQAIVIQDTKQGYQVGEYFGAAIVAGDINQDGLDDLIVGAPFYTNSKYNEGRIFIFLGSKKGLLETPQNSIIEGLEIGGQFGASLMFMGDLHMDGYADIAVGSPYENDGSGSIYIYRGNAQGLDPKPCQRIVGKNFHPNIRGFGTSMSRPTDIDNNFYDDLAIGAYASGHVVLLRSKPVVSLGVSVVPLTSRLDHNATEFQVKTCFWYTGKNVPPSIKVTRKVIVDDLLHRAHLPVTVPSTQNIILPGGKTFCQDINILIKADIVNRNNPITVNVSQELVSEQVQSKIISVDQNNQAKQTDQFCKVCPVLNTYKSATEKTVDLSFALGCGDDNVCVTQLNLQSKFLLSGPNDVYVLGSKDYLKLETNISNSGERAYLTQLIVELPKSVYFRSIPTNCVEQNSSSIISCLVGNPLYENNWKTLTLDLDMKEVNSDEDVDALIFMLTVSTNSVNKNPNKFTKTLKTIREADIALTGKTSQQSYSYGNITYGKPNFTQIYQVEKFGASPIDKVLLVIQIPTEIGGVKFLHLYTPEGYHADQPISCYSNVNYILDEKVDILTQFGPQATANVLTTTELPLLKRSVRDAQLKQQFLANETKTEFEFLFNRTFYINCTNNDVVCSQVTCLIGPFKSKQNLGAVLQIKMLFDVQALSDMLGTKDIIILSTNGFVTIKSPPNFVQSGLRPDAAIVSSVFVGETPESEVETWIIIVSVIAGLLLLLLLIMGLIKAGFFQRTKKMELEALKEAENAEKPQVPTKVCLLDWQLSRLGSPALDLAYFIFTCSDKALRDEHYDHLIQEYYDSLSSMLRKLGSDPDKLFPFKVLQEHLKKFSVYGLYMAIMVLFVMTSEVEEIPDIHNLTDMNDMMEKFQYESKNVEKYNCRISGEVEQFKRDSAQYEETKADMNDDTCTKENEMYDSSEKK